MLCNNAKSGFELYSRWVPLNNERRNRKSVETLTGRRYLKDDAIPSSSLSSIFIYTRIVSFYMVFLGIVFKTRLKYSKELLTTILKIQKLTLL